MEDVTENASKGQADNIIVVSHYNTTHSPATATTTTTTDLETQRGNLPADEEVTVGSTDTLIRLYNPVKHPHHALTAIR